MKQIHQSWVIMPMLLLLSISGCRRNVSVATFADNEMRISPDSTIDIEGVLMPLAIWNVGNKIFCYQKGEECLVSVDLDLRNMEVVCLRGHGNNEWIAPLVTGQVNNDSEGTSFYLLERANSVLYRMSLDSNKMRTEVLDLNEAGINSVRYIFAIDSSTFVGSLDEEDCRYFTLDTLEGELRLYKHPSPVNFTKTEGQEHELSQTLATYNERLERVAITYFSYPLLVIRSASGDILRTIQLSKDMPDYSAGSEMYDVNEYCLWIYSDDESIYVLYDDPALPEECSLMVFSWDGQPQKRYHINRASAFAIDRQSGRLITVNEDVIEGTLSFYTLEN